MESNTQLDQTELQNMDAGTVTTEGAEQKKTKDLAKKGKKVSELLFLSNPALTALLGALGFLETSPMVLAGAIGLSAFQAGFEILNRCKDSKISVVKQYEDVVEAALEKTRYTFRSSASRTMLIDRISNKKIVFGVEMKDILRQALEIQEKYQDDPAVQEILNTFDAHFKFTASENPSLSAFLLMYKTDTIKESLQYAVSLIESNCNQLNQVVACVQKIGEQNTAIQQIAEETQEDVKFVRRLGERGLEVGSDLAQWIKQSVIIFFIQGFFQRLAGSALGSGMFLSFAIIFLSEILITQSARVYQMKRAWVSALAQGGLIALANSFFYTGNAEMVLKSAAAVILAVLTARFLEWFSGINDQK